MSAKNSRIGVLMGGLSREREISLRTGKAIAQALRGLGYHIVEIDVGRDVAQQLTAEKVELAFIALHGRYGEDGAIQGLLELMGIPYTGSRLLASAIAMDKNLTKQLVQAAGVRVPAWEVVHDSAGPVPGPPSMEIVRRRAGSPPDFSENLALPVRANRSPVRGHPRQLNHLSLPVIIKPNREGSTIGMTIVRDPKELGPALEQALHYDETVLVEQYIQGREVTVGILEGKLLPILEVIPKEGFYDFKAKYTKGMTEYRVPALLEEKVTQEINTATLQVWETLGLRGVARADFMIDATGASWFLEVNTIPGMTETSLVPKAAAAQGISFEKLCERILESAR